MSATLAVSVRHPDGSLDAPYGAIVRVRPAGGRTDERCLPLQGSARFAVAAGEITVDAVFSSGRVETRTLRVADGEERDISFVDAAAPNESMRWLGLAREAARAAGPRSYAALADAALESFTRDPLRDCEVGLRARDGEARLKIAADARYDDCRVLHLSDGRDVAALRQRDGSAQTLLVVGSPPRPDVRVGVLPGPWRDGAPEEIHVALRAVDGDPLPDVEMVPRDERLATVIGFLERGDQRALGFLGKGFVDYAVGLMSGKQRDPLVAAVGLAVLLRLGDLGRVEGWSQNLWRWFPALPDGAALHAAVMLRSPQDDPAWVAELRSAALDAARAGAPLLTDSLRHLRRSLLVLRDLDRGDAPVAAALAWCGRLVRASDDAAVFTTVTIDPGALPTLWGAPSADPRSAGGGQR